VDLGQAGSFLRTRREALQPEDIGLRRGSRRRTAGLRREEVALIAGMSPDYLARLERGTGSQPSLQMVAALARALRLSVRERDHLLQLTGHPPVGPAGVDAHVSPGLMRILDSLTDVPAQVMGGLGETLAQNGPAVALFGEETGYEGLSRSAVYRWFAEGAPAERARYAIDEHDRHGRVLVAQLRAAAARHAPASIEPLVSTLTARSPEFAAIWQGNEVDLRYTETKHLVHPEVGDLWLHCQTVIDPERFHALLVLTATPGTESADKLRLLTVVNDYNLESFSRPPS